MTICCGNQDLKTPYCPYCGKANKEVGSLSLEGLLLHCRKIAGIKRTELDSRVREQEERKKQCSRTLDRPGGWEVFTEDLQEIQAAIDEADCIVKYDEKTKRLETVVLRWESWATKLEKVVNTDT